MPAEETEIKDRIKELIETLEENGSNLIKLKNGKTVEKVITDLVVKTLNWRERLRN